MTLVLLNQTTFSQLFGLFLVKCIYMILTVSFFPWRHASANISDRTTSISIISLLFLALSNASMSGESPETEQWAIIVSFVPLPVFFVQAICLALKGCTQSQQEIASRHQLIAAHLHNMFQSMSEMKDKRVVDLLGKLTSNDRRVLTAAADLILAEVHGQQPRTSRIAQRLIISDLVTPLGAEEEEEEEGDDTFDADGIQRDDSRRSPTYDTSKAKEFMLDRASPSSSSFEIVKAIFHKRDTFGQVPIFLEPKSSKEAQKEEIRLKQELQSKEATIEQKDTALNVLNAALSRKAEALNAKESELEERDKKLVKCADKIATYRSGLQEAERQIKLTAEYHGCVELQMQTQHLNHRMLVGALMKVQAPQNNGDSNGLSPRSERYGGDTARTPRGVLPSPRVEYNGASTIPTPRGSPRDNLFPQSAIAVDHVGSENCGTVA